MADPVYADEIASWGEYQIVVLSEVGELVNLIPLTDNFVNHPRVIVNCMSTIVWRFSGPKMDDLF